MTWLNELISQTIALIGQGHPVALSTLFLVVVFTEIGIPFPFVLDTALLLAGYQHGLSVQLLYTFGVVFIGRQFGAAIVYWASRLLGTKLLNWIDKRFPKIRIHIERISSKLSSRAPLAVAIPRLSGILHLTSIAAGIIRLPFPSFSLGVALSALIFDGAIIILGILTGHGFRILGFTPHLWAVMAVFIALMLLILLIRFLLSQKKRDNKVE
jgi:membrane protein DedA with SNARE-associated domain